MAKTVSNDALWEKLSEISEQLDRLSAEQKTQITNTNQEENSSDLCNIKDDIIAKIKQQGYLLGKHGDSNYKAINENITTSDETIRKIFNVVIRIRKQQKEVVEQKVVSKDVYFNFKFFKIRKTSFVIAVLGLLVFILTLFCMKQQNDYLLLIKEVVQ